MEEICSSYKCLLCRLLVSIPLTYIKRIQTKVKQCHSPAKQPRNKKTPFLLPQPNPHDYLVSRAAFARTQASKYACVNARPSPPQSSSLSPLVETQRLALGMAVFISRSGAAFDAWTHTWRFSVLALALCRYVLKEEKRKIWGLTREGVLTISSDH